MNKKWLIIGVVVVILVGLGIYLFAQSQEEETTTESTQTSTPAEEPVEETPERTLVYTVTSVLENVANDGSTGQASSTYYEDGAYEMNVEFQNLVPTANGDFYEGWLVNQETSDFFSTGMTTIGPEGTTVNTYQSTTDHQAAGYNFYVLTLEPDDGDPAPAAHILEGVLELAN